MVNQPPTPDSDAQHLEVEPYSDDERVAPPDWYNDDVNVGDEANKEAATDDR